MVDTYAGEYSTLSTLPALSATPDRYYNPGSNVPYTPPTNQATLAELERVKRILDKHECDHEEAWQAYQSLPSPRLALLPPYYKHRLLQKLTTLERKDPKSMFRYMSVMEQCLAIGYHFSEGLWNSAVAFSAHGYSRIEASGVEAAILKWKEMEKTHGVTAGYVTFNILFDLATKAQKFVLAEMILQEMEQRGLPISRHARVGIIYYHGMKGDGSAVRKAYHDFVESGEIVDTTVLNCVIASLLRSGEPQAAEMVFGRMKERIFQNPQMELPRREWRENRDLGKELARAARHCRDDPTRRKEIQSKQFLAPDGRTFRILVEHYAVTSGEIMKISSLVTEMHHFGMPVQGPIFVRIFKGFAYHGGKRYTVWTKARLESVWNALLCALDQQLEHLNLDRWLAVWIVRAFEKCFGPMETLAIWEELRKRWKEDEFRELGVVQDMLKGILTAAVQRQASV